MTDLLDHNEFMVTVDKVRAGDMIFLNAGDDPDGENQSGAWYMVQEEHSGGMYGPEHVGQWLVQTISLMHEAPYRLMTHSTEYEDDGDYNADMLVDHWLSDSERVRIRVDGVPTMTSDGELVRWWVNVYEVGQGYGGPEEGGWWFATGDLKATVPCGTYDKAQATRKLVLVAWENESDRPTHSVLYSGGNYEVTVQDREGRSYPEHQPHYS